MNRRGLLGLLAGAFAAFSVSTAAPQALMGAGSGAWTLITESSPSGTGTVTFSGIPGTYRDLRVVVRGAGTAAASNVTTQLRFNNDSGSNYRFQQLYANNSAVNSTPNGSATNINIGSIPASTGASNDAGANECIIYDYRGTTFDKTIFSSVVIRTADSSTAQYVQVFSGWWNSTAAITRVDVILSSGNFVAGSTVSLYGSM